MTERLLTLVLALTMAVGAGKVQAKSHDDYYLKKAYEVLDGDREDAGVEALRLIELQLEETPKNSEAYMLRAKIYLRRENGAQALADINQAIRNYSRKCGPELLESTLYIFRAYAYKLLDESDKAISDIDKAIELARKDNPDEVAGLIAGRANQYYGIGEYAMSDADYMAVLAMDETDCDAMVGHARNCLALEQYDEALEQLNRCAKLSPEYGDIYSFRCMVYDKLGDTRKAIDDFLAYCAISDNPRINDDYMLELFGKNWNYAIAGIKAQILQDSDDELFWRMILTSVYEKKYDYALALEQYDLIEDKFGEDERLCLYRADCYDDLGDTRMAVAEITRCMELDDDKDPETLAYYYIKRGDYYRRGGMYPEAIADESKAIEYDPKSVFPYYLRGWCYELSGDDQKALADYNLGIDIDEDYPYIFLMRGEMYRKLGDEAKACKDFEAVIAKDTIPEDGSCRMYALAFLGREDEAVQWMDSIISADPDNASLFYDKACLNARMCRVEEGLAALRRAFELGFRSFAHIEHDDDMDPLRDTPEYNALINEYLDKMIQYESRVLTPMAEGAESAEIVMKHLPDGHYELPCSINGLTLNFVFDTGADDVCISSLEANFMLKNNYLSYSDIMRKTRFMTADGSIGEGTVVRLRDVEVGGVILKNIEATVIKNQSAPLLLGQIVLEHFGTITIDNTNSKLIIHRK